jgi:hypothetical protein
MPDQVLVSDGAPLTWQDIESLPYYGLGALALAGTAYALANVGPAMQTAMAQAVLILALIGLKQAWLGMEQ